MHGGSLVIESNAGAGTTMVLHFPRERIAVTAVPTPALRQVRSA